MTVLPNVVVALISEIGRLSGKEAVRLGKALGMFMVILWTVAILANFTLPLAFPSWERASFFSPSLVAELGEFDFIKEYIPINVFNSLVSNVVPAV